MEENATHSQKETFVAFDDAHELSPADVLALAALLPADAPLGTTVRPHWGAQLSVVGANAQR